MATFGTTRRLAISAGLAIAGVVGTAAPVQSIAAAPQAQLAPCRDTSANRLVPKWARAGFTDAKPHVTQVLGRKGNIDAILFGNYLSSPPAADRNNKILWVSRLHVGIVSVLDIKAQRMQGTRTIGGPVYRRLLDGPGPSYVNLPQSGCWRLTLHWSGHSDSLDLKYR
jgi:hypothetical protein